MTCKTCQSSARIRGNDSTNKLGCMLHSKKVDATAICNDFLLSEKKAGLSSTKPNEGKSLYPVISKMKRAPPKPRLTTMDE